MSPHFNSLLDEQIGARTLIAFSGFYISESEVSFLEAGLSWTNHKSISKIGFKMGKWEVGYFLR